MNNTKAWLLGLVFGIIGAIISAAIFIYITLKTETIYGIIAILCGAISGGAVGLGYKLGKGSLKTKSEVQMFLWILTLFGLLGVLSAYFGPYIFFATNLGGLSLSLYISLLGIGATDIVFMLIGAYGGRWAGKSIARSIMMGELRHEAVQKIKQEGVKKIDKKFK